MKESIKSIAEWHEKTFPDATLLGQREKFYKEKLEWYASGCADITELADMFIVAAGMTRFAGIESMFCMRSVDNELKDSIFATIALEEAVDKKMEINRQRKWNFENGQYQHKEESK